MDIGTWSETRIRRFADPGNRAILRVLADADRPLDVETLAARLVDRDVTVVSDSEYDDRMEGWVISLHHDHLPELADAGLITYDPEANVVDTGSPTPDVTWHDSTTLTDVASHLLGTDVPDGDATGVVEEQESISQYGRQLTDEAEEEVFCLCVTADFLDERCMRSAQRALDRGVQMAIGSQNPEVRDLIREHLPDATTWEPQLDWLNSPSYPRAGRLVLIDRRKVMLSILGDSPDGDTEYEDRAIVGEGKTHPLVVLVRELLGSRLDHLDHQSADFRSEPVL